VTCEAFAATVAGMWMALMSQAWTEILNPAAMAVTFPASALAERAAATYSLTGVVSAERNAAYEAADVMRRSGITSRSRLGELDEQRLHA